MANSTHDPVMGLTIPTPGVDPGPEYAQEISDDLPIIAQHRHTGASNQDGYQVPTAGIDINADLSFNGFNATSLRTIRLTEQNTIPSGVGDIGVLYFYQGNAWLNTGSGIPVQINAGSSLAVTVSNSYPAKSLAGNYTINPSDGYIIFEVDTTASRIITLPAANSVANGRFIIVKDATGTANTHPITINAAGSDTIDGATSYVVKTNYGVVELISNGSNEWFVFKGDQNQYNNNESLSFTGSIFDDTTSPELNLNFGSKTTFASGSVLTLDASSVVAVYTEVDYKSGAILNIDSGGKILVDGGATLEIDGYQTIKSGGILNIASSGSLTTLGSSLLLQGSTFPTFATPQTKNRFYIFQPTALTSNWQTIPTGYGGALQTTAVTTDRIYFPIPVHAGATIASVTVIFSVSHSHSGVPAVLPNLSLRATRWWSSPQFTGNSSTGGATIFSGPSDGSFNTAEPIAPTGISSASIWNSYGGLGVWTYTPNVGAFANFPMDPTLYTYYGSIQDENGANAIAGNIYFAYFIEYTGINNLQFQ